MLEPIITITHAGLGLPPQRMLDGPFRAEWDPFDPESTAAAIVAALRFDKLIARDYCPSYSPRFFVDEEVWKKIAQRFHYIPRDRVVVHPSASEEDLFPKGLDRPAMWRKISETAGVTARQCRKSVTDAYGRPAVWVFAHARAYVIQEPPYLANRWQHSVRRAAREWIQDRWPVLFEILDGVPPNSRRDYQDIYRLRAGVTKGWTSSGRPAPYASVKAALRHAELIGAFKPGRKKRYYWGPVWRTALFAENTP